MFHWKVGDPLVLLQPVGKVLSMQLAADLKTIVCCLKMLFMCLCTELSGELKCNTENTWLERE